MTDSAPGAAPAIRLGIVGAARILNAHLRGIRLIREAGLADIRVTAIAARRIEDAVPCVLW